MKMEIFLAALRHIMTGLGVFAVAGGYAEDTAQWQVFVSEAIGVVGFGWSAYRKWARDQKHSSQMGTGPERR